MAWLRALTFVLATVSLLASGARAHVSIEAGETLQLKLCGDGAGGSVTLDLGGGPAAPAPHAACDCGLTAAATPPEAPTVPTRTLVRYVAYAPSEPPLARPGDPLWPGAPPQGPPVHLS
ncbi:MAG: hypothetical protein AAFX03_06595 [Pseudomonadota bacterium]